VEVDLAGARLTNADGIVLRGNRLWVVQNFSRQISKLKLDDRYSSATVEAVLATPADRTFTTAKASADGCSWSTPSSDSRRLRPSQRIAWSP
jgi:hypothetical protein